MPTRISPDQLANYLLCSFREKGELLTNLKLQKLAYYAQAWRLALTDEPLVGAEFQAWVHGPVCPPLYHRFKAHKWEPITAEVECPELEKDVVEHIDEVIEVYGGFGAWELERLVHTEAPWIEARSGLPSDAPCENVIPQSAMRDYYRSRIRPNGQDS